MLQNGAFLLLIFAVSCHGLYYQIGEKEERCFIQELPNSTPVIIYYEIQLYDRLSKGFMPSAPGFQMHVEVRDPKNKIVISRFYDSKDQIHFRSYTPGEHKICMYAKSTAWFKFTSSQLRVHLDIKVGERTIDYKIVAKRERFTELQMRVYQLIEQVEAIQKEYDYQRDRENIFRDINASALRHMIYWSFVQSALLLVLVLWKANYFRSWFAAKKLAMKFFNILIL